MHKWFMHSVMLTRTQHITPVDSTVSSALIMAYLLCAGPALCHILWAVPSEASCSADVVSLLAQPQAPRSHQ